MKVVKSVTCFVYLEYHSQAASLFRKYIGKKERREKGV